jgi:hypothetical protein
MVNMARATRISEDDYKTLKELRRDVRKLILGVEGLYAGTKYEDLEHAVLGLQIVDHALGEVEESKGMGGHIEPVSDPKAHKATRSLLATVRGLQNDARALLKTHRNEDLETAIKALEVSKGSLEEVLERYE